MTMSNKNHPVVNQAVQPRDAEEFESESESETAIPLVNEGAHRIPVNGGHTDNLWWLFVAAVCVLQIIQAY